MPATCGIINCGNRATRDHKRFFRLPAELKKGSDEKKQLSKQRRLAWINAIKREDLTETKLKYLLVCEDHFILGEPSNLLDKENPDWIPSKQLGYSNTSCQSALARFERSKTRGTKRFSSVLNVDTVQQEVESEFSPFVCQEVQTDLTMDQLDALIKCNHNYVQDIVSTKEKLNKLEISEDMFHGDDERTRYYSGIPTFQTLMVIFGLIKECLPQGPLVSLSPFQQFMLTLMHLRLNLDFHDLAYRFGISQSTASKFFYKCLFMLHMKLKRFIVWPEREVLKLSMPDLFKIAFGDKITVIIDCFEVQVEKPSNLLASAQTWSNYKQRHTIKFLIGICPQGTVSFISKAWGGRTSDKFLTENCGFLEKIIPGDLIIADRGFNIKESINLYCAEVILPAFTKGKKQLSAIDVEQTRNIATVRIHVERVIGSLRQKYRILEAAMPINMLSKNYCDGSTAIDQIITVCCSFINICPSVIPME